MGNRAVITLDQNPTSNSIGIYLHWNGGVESVLAFAEAARIYQCRDGEYGVARLAQIIGNFFGGTLSIGVDTLKNLDVDNGDNGLFAVMWNSEEVFITQWADGNYLEKSGAKVIDCNKVKQHSYWTSDEPILQQVLNANDAAFKKKD